MPSLICRDFIPARQRIRTQIRKWLTQDQPTGMTLQVQVK